jgi:hypothetical protein
LFAPWREKIQIQLTTYFHKLLLVIGVLKKRLWWNWHNDKESLLETIDSVEFTFQRMGRGFLCIFANYVASFSDVDSTTHNWTTIHVCDNVSFLRGGLHASCNKVSFKGRLLATMFILKVRYMHLCKNVLSGGHLYIPRFLFKGGLCASLATMLIFKGRLHASSLKQCSFRRSIFHPKVIFSIKALIKKGVHMWSSMSIQAYNMLAVHCNMYNIHQAANYEVLQIPIYL